MAKNYRDEMERNAEQALKDAAAFDDTAEKTKLELEEAKKENLPADDLKKLAEKIRKAEADAAGKRSSSKVLTQDGYVPESWPRVTEYVAVDPPSSVTVGAVV